MVVDIVVAVVDVEVAVGDIRDFLVVKAAVGVVALIGLVVPWVEFHKSVEYYSSETELMKTKAGAENRHRLD